MSQDYLFKLLIVGESGVGKTCILLRFAEDSFEETFLSTIGVDFKVREIQCRDKQVKLQIWDSAGQERFRNITSSYYRNCHGIIIVYDITNRESFTKVSEWIEEVKRYVPNAPLMLIGNKCDLEDKRQVQTVEGEDLAKRLGLVFVETSAKSSRNIDQAFTTLSEKLIDDADRNPKTEAPKKVVLADQTSEEKKKKCC